MAQSEFKIKGSEDLLELSKKLKESADTGLSRKLNKGIREGTAPIPAAIRASELARLPKRGGLAARIASGKIVTRIRKTQRNPGVTIEAIDSYDIKSIDRGRIRHRVFGRNVWVNQKVEPGTISEPVEKLEPVVRERVSQAMKDIAEELGNN